MFRHLHCFFFFQVLHGYLSLTIVLLCGVLPAVVVGCGHVG